MDTLVFLCQDVNSALICAAKTPQSAEYGRLFAILGGPTPQVSDFEWVDQADSLIVLADIEEWSGTPVEIAIRAGFVFSTGINVLFCWHDSLPSKAEIIKAQSDCNSKECHSSQNIWGYSRHFIVKNGMPSQSQQSAVTNTVPIPSNISNTDFSKAMKGLPAPSEAVMKAVAETAPLRSVHIETQEVSPNCQAALDHLKQKVKDRILKDAESVIMCGNFAPADVMNQCLNIQDAACVVFIYEMIKDHFYKSLPFYRKFETDDGCGVLLLRKAK